jgi:hypothetical protein
MKNIFAAALICILLFLAIGPWALSGCKPQSLMPEPLRKEKYNYEATVDAVREETAVAIRSAPSVAEVIPIGTIAATEFIEQKITAFSSQSTSQVIIYTVTPVTPMPSPPLPSATNSVTPLRPTPTATSTPTPQIPLETATKLATIAPSNTPNPTSSPVSGLPPTPKGMVAKTDILTENDLQEQLKRDAAGSSITDLVVTLTLDGMTINGNMTVLGIKQKITANGTFLVRNDSLIISVTSIMLADSPVTAQYREQMESRLNFSIYQLLPMRYVQSFNLQLGKVTVSSLVRP